MTNLVESGLYRGASLHTVHISYLFYDDDVMLLGECSSSNMLVIKQAFDVFFLVSGLRINYQKSSLIGIGVNKGELKNLAAMIGCNVNCLPFMYLGVPIGARMSRISHWQPIIQRFQKRLSKWNANLLSIGGRLTLITAVLGALGIYYFSLFRVPMGVLHKMESLRSSFFWGKSNEKCKLAWIKWKNILTDRDKGGLGVGSLNALNLVLLFKWKWRALSDPNALWVRIVSDIYGGDTFSSLVIKGVGTWASICAAVTSLHHIDFFPSSIVSKKVGSGNSTKFWLDEWLRGGKLAERFTRLFALETNKSCMVSDKWEGAVWSWGWRRNIRDGLEATQLQELKEVVAKIKLNGEKDTWEWKLNGETQFSIRCLRRAIDTLTLPSSAIKTQWNKLVPKKVNIFAWRLMRDRLPTRHNLSRQGIQTSSYDCVLCNGGLEDATHIFWNCPINVDLRVAISKWIQLDIPSTTPCGVLEWTRDLMVDVTYRRIVQAIMFVWWWSLWKHRNEVLFEAGRSNSSEIFHSIVTISFLWIANRCRKRSLSWQSWLCSPSYLM